MTARSTSGTLRSKEVGPIAPFEVNSAKAFVSLLLTARQIATSDAVPDRTRALTDLATSTKALRAFLKQSGLSRTAAALEHGAGDAIHFTHPGPARDDAIRVFGQVAPVALLDFEALSATPLHPKTACDQIIATIKASSVGHDFIQTTLAEHYFRTVTLPVLQAMT